MKLATRPSTQAGCIRALQSAFSTHALAVSVKEFGADCYTVRFMIEDQVFACIATSAMPGFSRPEDTMFLAESFALARESEWVMIDGFSLARRPNSEMRAGTALEIAEPVIKAAEAFLEERSLKAARAA